MRMSKIVRPVLAAAALAVALWLVFHDRSVAAVPAVAGGASSTTPVAAAGLSLRAPSRTLARTADPASSRS
jgi:hypothetical protein